MRRILATGALAGAMVVLGGGPALACGGLIGRNGTVSLVRTTTLAGYHDGVEHYVTSFRFAGAGGAFGSIVPLPGVPSDVARGGDWSLQRLVREVAPPLRADNGVATMASAAAPAEVLLETRIDALDLTVLRGGGRSVGEWAAANGFTLTPDAPEVLDFYASRSPIFLAARFDGEAARQRNISLGEGIPIHLTIPTSNPWVPLRILGLGRQPVERVQADVFLLTDARPTILAAGDRQSLRSGHAGPGLVLDRQEPANAVLLDDLRADKGMDWVPQSMWLSYLKVDASPADLTYDLAVDASGAGQPSRVAAGLGPDVPERVVTATAHGGGAGFAIAVGIGAALLIVAFAGVGLVLRRTGPVPTER